jgi:hypothetical protein
MHNADETELAHRYGCMARFFLHFYGDVVARDEEGVELPDLQAARTLAIAAARELASADVLQGRLNVDHRIDIEDVSGTVIEIVYFREAVRIDRIETGYFGSPELTERADCHAERCTLTPSPFLFSGRGASAL